MKLQCIEIARAVLGEPAKTSGREAIYECPHHDDQHPSLKINLQKDVWMCGPCGAKGGAWTLAAFLAGRDPDDKAGVIGWLGDHGLITAVRSCGKIVDTY